MAHPCPSIDSLPPPPHPKALQKHFLEFHNFLKFSENFETILINVHFQFCLAAESIGQDGAILPNDQPIKLQESRVG